MNKKIGILIDTETIGNKHIYDIAYYVIDLQGNILESYNAVNVSLFNEANFNQFFDSPFITYRKYRWYEKALQSHAIMGLQWRRIMQTLKQTIKYYNVCFITAYNLTFDVQAIRNTCELYSEPNPFESFSLQFIDLWKLAQSHIATNAYNNHCVTLGWLTEKTRKPRTNAECIYRYISKNDSFVESHTALADCDIELTIYKKCRQKKKRYPDNAYLKISF